MNAFRAAWIVVACAAAASCGGRLSAMPTGPTGPAAPAPAAISAGHVVAGSVGPAGPDARICFADRYPCTVYVFALAREGPIEVTLTWDGAPRALFVQLYWAGEGLAHEDVAPRSGPSQISFLRPRMEAAGYEVRVVSREPESAIPFTLTLTY